MANRKTEIQTGHGAMDRGRVAERLRAALAGLHELHVLREKQADMVQGALRTDGEHQRESDPSTEEQQRLEATLTALKQQLARLRRQDVGLKTHLQQLDQQINELKLDTLKASAEHLESDSRPSSGFFELSDGGLGSLSNSCTSVYSECLLYSSQASLLNQSSTPLAPPGRGTPLQADVSRRRSADEPTAQPDVPRGLGVRLGSSGIRTGSISSERARKRPVSTGDLDRMIGPSFGYYNPIEVKASALSSKLCDSTVDPKYQSNLVSRSGSEVYSYPSPLHAVALQSPIFSLSGDYGALVASELQERQTNPGLLKDNPRQDLTDSRPEGYITKLLQRSSSKMSLQSEMGTEKAQISPKDMQGLIKFRTSSANNVVEERRSVSSENPVEDRKKSQPRHVDQEQMNLACVRAEELEQMCHGQYPPRTRVNNPASVTCKEKTNDQENKDSFKGASVVSKPPEIRPSFRQSREEIWSRDGGHAHNTAQSEFVCARFVPAGSQRVKVRHADKRTKAVKLRKKGNEKPPVKKQQQQQQQQQHRHSCREQDKEKGCIAKTRGDSKFIERIEPRLRSCSESSLLVPGNHCDAYLQSYRKQKPTSKSNKPQKAQCPDLDIPPLCQTRKKQSSQKWSYAPEIPPPAAHQRFKEIHRASQKPGMVRSLSVRPHSGHWGGFPRPCHPSLSSSSSYFSNLDLKYPPAPVPRQYPSRCESEYSAECASLFHSTIAESSEGELSDFTTNRFGDSESSQDSHTASDSDSSLSLDEDDLFEEDEDEAGLVWAEAAVGPTAAGNHRPEPAACRIKASRALKKKIRRFQPASLKVMTMV